MNITIETLEPRDLFSVTPMLTAPDDSQNAAMLLPAVQASREVSPQPTTGARTELTRQTSIIQDM
jgi:hypothetical protein